MECSKVGRVGEVSQPSETSSLQDIIKLSSMARLLDAVLELHKAVVCHWEESDRRRVAESQETGDLAGLADCQARLQLSRLTGSGGPARALIKDAINEGLENLQKRRIDRSEASKVPCKVASVFESGRRRAMRLSCRRSRSCCRALRGAPSPDTCTGSPSTRLEYDVANREGAVALLQEGSEPEKSSILDLRIARPWLPEPPGSRASAGARAIASDCEGPANAARVLRWPHRQTESRDTSQKPHDAQPRRVLFSTQPSKLRKAPGIGCTGWAGTISKSIPAVHHACHQERLHIPKAPKQCTEAMHRSMQKVFLRLGQAGQQEMQVDPEALKTSIQDAAPQCRSVSRAEVGSVPGTAAKSPDMAMQTIKGHVPSRLRPGQHSCHLQSANLQSYSHAQDIHFEVAGSSRI